MRPNSQSTEAGQGLGQGGLADAGHVLEQQVALGDEAEHRQLDDVGLAPDGPADGGGDGAEQLGERRRAGLGLLGGHPLLLSTTRGHGLATRPVRLRGREAFGTVGGVTGDLALAVDIGGTKLEVGLVDLEGAVVRRARAATPAREGAEDMFGALAGLVAEVLDDGADPVVCGVGTGGPMTRGGATVSPINIPAWRGFPLHDRLAELTEVPTFVDNDAKALALGEGWVGAAPGCDDYVAMVVSTGVGGGIVLDGRLLDGADGNAGHIGHVIVVPDGHRCGCGARGCLEAEASGTAIAAITGRPGRRGRPRDRRAHRHPRGPGGGVGGQPARPAPGRGGRVGGPRVRRALLRRRPGRDRPLGPPRLLDRHGDPPGALGADGPLVGAAAVGWRGLGVAIGR